MSREKFETRAQQFEQYNNCKLTYCIDQLSRPQRTAMQIVADLFHYNSSYLPGFAGEETPAGIAGYKTPDENLKEFRKINNKIKLEELEEAEEALIEGIYYQELYKTGGIQLWVIYSEGLDSESVNLLKRKCGYIRKWLLKNTISLKIYACEPCNLANTYYDAVNDGMHIDKSFFIGQFYLESTLLAGKAPLWWLLDEDEADGEFDPFEVDSEAVEKGYMSFNESQSLRLEDYYSAGVWHVLNISSSPMTTWLNLILLIHSMENSRAFDMYLFKLKTMMHNNFFDDLKVDVKKLYVSYLNGVINQVLGNLSAIVSPGFIKVLADYYRSNNKHSHETSMFDYLLEIRTSGGASVPSVKIDLCEYIDAYEAIYKLTEKCFAKLMNGIESKNNLFFEKITDLTPISERFLLKLKQSSNNLNILSDSSGYTHVQDKVVLDYEKDEFGEVWKLMLPDVAGKCQHVKSFKSVIGLLVWGFINRVVDTNTQVSYPGNTNKLNPLDIVNVVKLLSENIDMTRVEEASLSGYTSNPYPVESLMFVDMYTDFVSNKSARINQIIIFNNGEFHTQEYFGYDNFISCVQNWYALINDENIAVKPVNKIFAIHPGSTQRLESSVAGLMNDLGDYLGGRAVANTRAVLKKGDKYYVSHFYSGEISSYTFNGETEFYKYLEFPLEEYTTCLFSESFDKDLMLSYLLKQNKKDTIQMFYYIEQRRIKVFVFDRHGAMFAYEQSLYNRQSFINHWLLFLHNMRNKAADKVLVEISQLIKLDNITYEHLELKGNMLPTDKKYYTLELLVSEENGRKSISFTCEDKTFTSNEQGVDIYEQISRFIAENLMVSSDIPVYVSNIDVPEQYMQASPYKNADYLIEYLKYKRNVEKRLNQKFRTLV